MSRGIHSIFLRECKKIRSSCTLFVYMDTAALRFKLNSQTINSHLLFGTCKVLDESTRTSPEYTDSRNLPFYYHLGSLINPKKVVQIGSRLGLVAAAMTQSCKSIEKWTAIDVHNGEQDPEYIPRSIVSSNIRCFREMTAHTTQVDWVQLCLLGPAQSDLGLMTANVNKDCWQESMGFLWDQTSPEGLLVVDYINHDPIRELFDAFCRVKNRSADKFDTRHGIGIIKR